MSNDSFTAGAQQRRRSRGGRNRNNKRGPSTSPTPRAGTKAPSGFQKLLNTLSFGLLGKSKPPLRASQRPKAETTRGVSSDSNRPPREPRPRRDSPKVTPADITTERLYIGNLSYDATESDLFELFNGVGSVRNAEVVVNNRTQRSKGFAFVTMATLEEARRAVEELNGKDFMGRPLQLSGAKPLTDAPPSRNDESEES